MGRRIAALPLLFVLVALAAMPSPLVPPARAAGFISFEEGRDRTPIRASISGLAFTNTAGYDWVYGDWRSGNYNGRYPNGAYTSNGDFFAWLGPSQGYGQITFTQGDATYLSVWVSTAEPVTLEGYAADGTRVARAQLAAPNIRTGRLEELRIEAPQGGRLSYAYIYGTANRWLIDDLATDAGGVPDTRTPLVILPGIMGTELRNDDGLIWPDTWRIMRSPGDEHLGVLELATDGETPVGTTPAFTSVQIGDIVRNDGRLDVYAPLIRYLVEQRGYVECPNPATVCPEGTLFVFPYDWRKDPSGAASRLGERIEAIRTATGAAQVNLLAHSMGGLVARTYLDDAANQSKVATLVTLGTPYLGAPKAYHGLHYAACLAPPAPVGCWLNRGMSSRLMQNYPGNYALVPSAAYFKARPDGHIRRDYDDDGDGAADGWLSSDTISRTLRTRHNAYLTTRAAALHEAIDGYSDWAGLTQVFAVVGYGQGETPGAVREYLEAGEGERAELRHEILRDNGDGTVPLVSATLGRYDGAADLSGGVPIFYVRGEHGELPKIDSVQRLAADLFDTRGIAATAISPTLAGRASAAAVGAPGEELLRARTDTTPAQEAWRPVSEAPVPLSGRWVQLSGKIAVTITDAAGATMRVAADGTIEEPLPGMGAYRLQEATAIFLPAAGGYTLQASGVGALDLRAAQVVADAERVTVAYANVALGAGATASLELPQSGVASAPLGIDRDGDGVAEEQVAPVGVLTGEAGADRVPPTSTAALNGQRTPRGWYTGQVEVTLTAEDGAGGSSVARLEYSLDGGRSYAAYAGPFRVDAGTARVVLVRAVDKAGNEQYPLTAARLGPEQLSLPLLRR